MNNEEQIQDFILRFIKIFHSELICNSQNEESMQLDNVLSESRENYIMRNYKNMKMIFFGYDNKELPRAIDDYEFYLAILSFFNRYGKVARQTEYNGNVYYENIHIMFYNHLTDEIEYITHSKSFENGSDQNFVHLFFTSVLREIIYEILCDIESLSIDAYQIKLFSHKFDYAINKEEQLEKEENEQSE